MRPAILAWIMMASTMFAADFADIVVSTRDFGQGILANTNVTMIPVGPLRRTYGTNLIVLSSKTQRTDTNGVTTFTNTLWGTYDIQVPGTAPTKWRLNFSNTNLVSPISAATLVIDPQTLPPNPATNYYTMSQVDALLAEVVGTGSATNLTPWPSDINAASHSLTNATDVRAENFYGNGSGLTAVPPWVITNLASVLRLSGNGSGDILLMSENGGLVTQDGVEPSFKYEEGTRTLVSSNILSSGTINAAYFIGDGSGLTGLPGGGGTNFSGIVVTNWITGSNATLNGVIDLSGYLNTNLATTNIVLLANRLSVLNSNVTIACVIGGVRNYLDDVGNGVIITTGSKFTNVNNVTAIGRNLLVTNVNGLVIIGKDMSVTNNDHQVVVGYGNNKVAFDADATRFTSPIIVTNSITLVSNGPTSATIGMLADDSLGITGGLSVQTLLSSGPVWGSQVNANNFYSPSNQPTIGQVITAVSANGESTWQNSGDMFNVRSYGAVGDSVTDDTAAIQAAYNAASPKRGTVYFPGAYTFKVTSTIFITNGVHTFGDTAGAPENRRMTNMLYTGTGHAFDINGGSTAPCGAGFHRFSIVGPTRDVSTGAAFYITNTQDHFYFEEVNVYRFKYAVFTSQTGNSTYQRCIFSDQENCMYLDGSATLSVNVIGSVFGGQPKLGFRMNGGNVNIIGTDMNGTNEMVLLVGGRLNMIGCNLEQSSLARYEDPIIRITGTSPGTSLAMSRCRLSGNVLGWTIISSSPDISLYDCPISRAATNGYTALCSDIVNSGLISSAPYTVLFTNTATGSNYPGCFSQFPADLDGTARAAAAGQIHWVRKLTDTNWVDQLYADINSNSNVLTKVNLLDYYKATKVDNQIGIGTNSLSGSSVQFGLDVVSDYGIFMGNNIGEGRGKRSNNTWKRGMFVGANYGNSEEGITLLDYSSASTADSYLNIGGSSSSFNAISRGVIYGAANGVTTKGVEVAGWNTNGLYTISGLNVRTNPTTFPAAVSIGAKGVFLWNDDGVLKSVHNDSAGAYSITNRLSPNFTTNFNLLAPNFAVFYSMTPTNGDASFTFQTPVNVSPTMAETAVVFVTNSSAAELAAVAPANFHTKGTWNITNVTAFTFFHYGWSFSNAIAFPLW